MALAVTNHVSKEDMLEVVGVTYEMERMMRPKSDEVH
jgi:hypothetical protein